MTAGRVLLRLMRVVGPFACLTSNQGPPWIQSELFHGLFGLVAFLLSTPPPPHTPPSGEDWNRVGCDNSWQHAGNSYALRRVVCLRLLGCNRPRASLFRLLRLLPINAAAPTRAGWLPERVSLIMSASRLFAESGVDHGINELVVWRIVPSCPVAH